MSKTIPLHPDRMLDPHLCFCPRCGSDTNELTVGHIVKVKHEGVTHYTQRGSTRKYERDNNLPTSYWEDLTENEKVPGSICPECSEEMDAFSEIVKDGGAYFICEECEQQGVIRNNEAIDNIREQMKTYAPEPIVLKFTTCSEHGG